MGTQNEKYELYEQINQNKHADMLILKHFLIIIRERNLFK